MFYQIRTCRKSNRISCVLGTQESWYEYFFVKRWLNISKILSEYLWPHRLYLAYSIGSNGSENYVQILLGFLSIFNSKYTQRCFCFLMLFCGVWLSTYWSRNGMLHLKTAFRVGKLDSFRQKMDFTDLHINSFKKNKSRLKCTLQSVRSRAWIRELVKILKN